MATTQKKDCDYCRRDGLQILPLRYAVAYGKDDKEAQALKTLAPLSGLLGEGVAQTALTKSHYTTRLLRAGYLYPVVNRKGTLRCETVYSVSDEGFLRPTPWDSPKPNDHQPCQPGVCGLNASTISIKEAKDVTEVFILFSPVPLSPGLLNDYVKKLHSKAQSFKPKDWMDGKQNQKHTLPVAEWRKTIAEFAALDHPELLNCFKPNEVFFPFYGSPDHLPDALEITRQRARLEGLEKKFLCEKNLMTVVLHDPLGITQELNQARNQVFNFFNEQIMVQPFATKNAQKMYWGFDPDTDPEVQALDKQRDKDLNEIKDVSLNFTANTVGTSTEMALAASNGPSEDIAATKAYYDAKRDALIKRKKEAWAKTPSASKLIHNRDAAQVGLLLEQLHQQWETHRLKMAGSYFDNKYDMLSDRNKVIIQTDPDWTKKVSQPGYYHGKIYKDEAEWQNHLQRIKNKNSQVQKATGQQNQDDWKAKYFNLYDHAELEKFQNASHDALDKGRIAATAKTQDHLKWLQSPKLVAALAWYDTKDPAWGVAYTSTVGHLLSGIVGTADGLALMQKWANATKIEPDNLLLRGLAFAQTEVEQGLAYKGPADTNPAIAWANVQKNVGYIAKHIDKAHGVIDAFETGKGFSTAFIGTASYSWLYKMHMNGYFKLVENLYCLLVKLPAEKLSLPFVSLIVGNLGSSALSKIKLGQWLTGTRDVAALLKRSPGAVAANELAAEFEALKKDTGTKWASLRIGSLLALLEVWNLRNKINKLPDGSEKVYMEFGAAILTTSAAGLELCGRGVELVGARGVVLTEASAKVASSGLKLFGGFLGAVAGFVGVLVDKQARDKAEQRKQDNLVLFYNFRINLQYGVIGVAVLSAYAASAPFLKYLAEQTIKQGVKETLAVLIGGAEWVAAGRAFLLIGGFWLAVGTVAVSFAILYLEDDSLQAYLRRSLWRSPDSKEPLYENIRKEIDALALGFGGVA